MDYNTGTTRKVRLMETYKPERVLMNCLSAAIMRIGLIEMKNFCQEFFQNVKDETFLEESAGVADLITSCEWSSRNTTIFLFVRSPTAHVSQVLVVGIENAQRRLSPRRK